MSDSCSLARGECSAAAIAIPDECVRTSLMVCAERLYGDSPESFLGGVLALARARFERRDGNLDRFHLALKSNLPCAAQTRARYDLLPSDVLDNILKYLSNDPVSLARASQVCRTWLVEFLAQGDFSPSLRDIAPLVFAGADLKHRHGRVAATPMLLAAFHGHVHALDFLLKNGSSRDETAGCGKNAILLASLRNHQSLVAVLLGRGFSSRDMDNCGNTPLMLAALGGSKCVMKYLHSQGACMGHTNVRNETALHLAAQGGCLEAIDALVQWCPTMIDCRDNSGLTPFLTACHYGRGLICCLFSKKGADLSAVDKNGANAIMQAAMGGLPSNGAENPNFETHANLVKCLGRRYDLGARDLDGRTAMHYAVLCGNDLVQQQLIQANVEARPRDTHGADPYDYLRLYQALKEQNAQQAAAVLAQLRGVAMSFPGRLSLTAAHLRCLCRALSQNTTVRVVHLSCKVNSAEVEQDLVALLKVNKTLRHLRLGWNQPQELPHSVLCLLNDSSRLPDLHTLHNDFAHLGN
ncbi:uncharacterized protein MONBRDRAFT_5834 [Monosiga brevicollis MX1]|uniref:F-box domain-containing protein n=1 Tax=Monosiga brevicollis TaxID=81824 RepID=A9USL6_MONBE|nr:uncharacterized protein MONBRDRAFT_5834 [Monosiga brevicollis MX1]EDQ91801.1 predicted protein [Monosiga brevicollis MX1]|eukprot:XP_001743087.1 hypothetical protein [Monosiga brevicollis MX1]